MDVAFAYDSARKYMHAEDINFEFEIKVGQFAPTNRKKDNHWIIYAQESRNENRLLASLSHEFAHVIHRHLLKNYYIDDPVINEPTGDKTKAIIEAAKRLCWSEGLANRISECTLAQKIGSQPARNTVEEICINNDVIAATLYDKEPNSEGYPDADALKARVAQHYVYIIGYIGCRDVAEDKFFELLRQKDAHQSPLLVWNRSRSGSERQKLTSLLHKSEKITKQNLEGYIPEMQVPILLTMGLIRTICFKNFVY